MLKSIQFAALGLFATSLTLSVISPVGAVVSTTKSEPVVAEEEQRLSCSFCRQKYTIIVNQDSATVL